MLRVCRFEVGHRRLLSKGSLEGGGEGWGEGGCKNPRFLDFVDFSDTNMRCDMPRLLGRFAKFRDIQHDQSGRRTSKTSPIFNETFGFTTF